jgi:hypothetical protein
LSNWATIKLPGTAPRSQVHRGNAIGVSQRHFVSLTGQLVPATVRRANRESSAGRTPRVLQSDTQRHLALPLTAHTTARRSTVASRLTPADAEAADVFRAALSAQAGAPQRELLLASITIALMAVVSSVYCVRTFYSQVK